jgi:lipopolysaccharide assembly protein A
MSSETTETKRRGGGRVGRFALRYWVAIVLVVLAAIFVAQNRSRISVNIYWVSVTSPLWLLLTVLFVVGLVIGLLLGRRRR